MACVSICPICVRNVRACVCAPEFIDPEEQGVGGIQLEGARRTLPYAV